MRKLLCIILAVLLLALCGCSQAVEVMDNEKYAIMQDGEAFYLSFHDRAYEEEYRSQTDGGQNAMKVARAVGFNTVAEMKEKLETGNFTKQELVRMQAFERKNGAVEVCDVNKLYDIKLPEGVNLNGISWYGKTYSFSFSGDVRKRNYGDIDLIRKERYDQMIALLNRKAEDYTYTTIISESVDPQTNGTVTIYDYNGLKKKIVYTYTDGENTIAFEEMYPQEDNFEVPEYVSFWGHCGGVYYDGVVYGLTERPGYEWITSFGLTPYVEKEVS